MILCYLTDRYASLDVCIWLRLTVAMLQDLERIYAGLCDMSVFCRLRDSELRSLALTVRYQTALANDILFW